MSKVYLICGKICSGKTYYSNRIKKELNAVLLSPDEATYDLINNEQGEFYNIFSERLIKYLDKKSVEIVKSGANVVYERGLWSKKDREYIKKYYKDNNIEYEIHYIYVNDETWNKNIEKRNNLIEEGIDKESFYLDEGLKNKLLSKFEEPTEDEYDILIDNN